MKPLISWHNSFSVNNEIIDSQHKKLIDIINHFYEVFKRKGNIEEIEQILAELKDYTKYHFSAEESIMEKAGYPDLEEHKRSHNQLVEKIVDIEKKFLDRKITVNFEMMTFLRLWLTNHILEEDKLYINFI